MFKQLGFEVVFRHNIAIDCSVFKVGSLHSEILQSVRTASLAKFRSGRIRILISTDVAARGLDIPHVAFHNFLTFYLTLVFRSIWWLITMFRAAQRPMFIALVGLPGPDVLVLQLHLSPNTTSFCLNQSKYFFFLF